jgi:hypothetical protein
MIVMMIALALKIHLSNIYRIVIFPDQREEIFIR